MLYSLSWDAKMRCLGEAENPPCASVDTELCAMCCWAMHELRAPLQIVMASALGSPGTAIRTFISPRFGACSCFGGRVGLRGLGGGASGGVQGSVVSLGGEGSWGMRVVGRLHRPE